MNFSTKNREAFVSQLNNSSFDILIIGGGITGAGIALDDYFQVKSHIFTVVLMLLSVIASMYVVIKGLMK